MSVNVSKHETSVSNVGVNSYKVINFDMFFDKSGNLTQSLKNFEKKDLIEGLESINSTEDVVYSFKHIQNKINLKKLKAKSDLKTKILSYTALCCFLLIICLMMCYFWKKKVNVYRNPNRSTPRLMFP